jgi:hypothetical protein
VDSTQNAEVRQEKKKKCGDRFSADLGDAFEQRYGVSSVEATDAVTAIPVFFTSAITGEGVLELEDFIARRSERHGVPMQVLTQLLALANCLSNSKKLGDKSDYYMQTEEYHMDETVATFKKELNILVKDVPSSSFSKAFKAWEVQLTSGGSGAAIGQDTSSLLGLLSAVSSCGGEEIKWNTVFLDSVLGVVQELQVPVVDQLSRLILALEALVNRASRAMWLSFHEANATLQAFRDTAQHALRRAVARVIRDRVDDISGKRKGDGLAKEIREKLQKYLPEQIGLDLQGAVKETLKKVVDIMKATQAAWSLNNLGSRPETAENPQVFFVFFGTKLVGTFKNNQYHGHRRQDTRQHTYIRTRTQTHAHIHTHNHTHQHLD